MRVAMALAAGLLAGYGGWWWHQPDAALRQMAAARQAALPGSGSNDPPPAADMAARLKAADPMGLNQAGAPGAAPGTPSAPPGAEVARAWRVSALVVRGKDSYAVLTSEGQDTLVVHAGETLPDGDRVTAVKSDRIDIKSPRGRLRTLYLIEP